MLMTLRGNGIFPDQQNTQSLNNFTPSTSQVVESVGQDTEESPLRTSSPLRSAPRPNTRSLPTDEPPRRELRSANRRL
ncbi:unnamed protein product [Diplocarpon coronariae]